jgi:hypothetical protein
MYDKNRKINQIEKKSFKMKEKKLSNSCQKVVKKLLKSCQKVSKTSKKGRRRRRRRRRFVAPRPGTTLLVAPGKKNIKTCLVSKIVLEITLYIEVTGQFHHLAIGCDLTRMKRFDMNDMI